MSTDPTARRSIAGLLLSAFFLAGIFTPPIATLLAGPDGSAAVEGRTPAPAPSIPSSPAEQWEFPEAFRDWYRDHFRLREPLLRWFNAAHVLVLGDSPDETLLVGRDGWLFYAADSALESSRAERPYTEVDLVRVRRVLEDRRDWLAARDIGYLFVIVPNKHTLYPEKLPAWHVRSNPHTRLEVLGAELAGSEVDFLDLTPVLRAGRGRGLVYYPHGTHWSHLGAWLGAEAIVEHLPQIFGEGAVDHPDERVRIAPERGIGDSWATKLHLVGLLRQEVPFPYPLTPQVQALPLLPSEHSLNRHGTHDLVWENPDPSPPRILLFSDSCAAWLWVHLRPYASRITTRGYVPFDPDAVRAERPNLLIQQRAERALDRSLPPQVPMPRAELDQARRWLAAAPVELLPAPSGPPGSARAAGRWELELRSGAAAHWLAFDLPGSPDAPADLILRLETQLPVAGELTATWHSGAAAEPRRKSFPARAGPAWAFLELGSVQRGGRLVVELPPGVDLPALAPALRVGEG